MAHRTCGFNAEGRPVIKVLTCTLYSSPALAWETFKTGTDLNILTFTEQLNTVSALGVCIIFRATFVEEWFHTSHPGGMVIFEHDLKNVTVAFQNQEEGNIYKLEFPYKEIHDFVLVDTARPRASTSTLFIPLRSVPKVLQAEGKIYANLYSDCAGVFLKVAYTCFSATIGIPVLNAYMA